MLILILQFSRYRNLNSQMLWKTIFYQKWKHYVSCKSAKTFSTCVLNPQKPRFLKAVLYSFKCKFSQPFKEGGRFQNCSILSLVSRTWSAIKLHMEREVDVNQMKHSTFQFCWSSKQLSNSKNCTKVVIQILLWRLKLSGELYVQPYIIYQETQEKKSFPDIFSMKPIPEVHRGLVLLHTF